MGIYVIIHVVHVDLLNSPDRDPGWVMSLSFRLMCGSTEYAAAHFFVCQLCPRHGCTIMICQQCRAELALNNKAINSVTIINNSRWASM